MNKEFNIITLPDFKEENLLTIVDNIVGNIESGETRPLPAFLQAKALAWLSKEIENRVKDLAIEEAATYGKDDSIFNGARFTIKSTGERLDYSEDIEYAELESKLKARKDLLNDAYKMFVKHGKPLIDDKTGELVPVVRIKTESQQTISVSFK